MRQYENHLTVFLEWMAEKWVTYNVRTETATVAENVATSSAQINVSYNIHYNVSVEATLCGQMNVSAAAVEIYYGEFL
jgi:hypothetical protein